MEDKIDVIVKIPLDRPSDKVLEMGQYVIEELIKERDWKQPHEKKMTFKPKDETKVSDGSNFVEFKMRLTSGMTNDDLRELALQFIKWLKDTDK